MRFWGPFDPRDSPDLFPSCLWSYSWTDFPPGRFQNPFRFRFCSTSASFLILFASTISNVHFASFRDRLSMNFGTLGPSKSMLCQRKTILFLTPRFRGKVVYWINSHIAVGMFLVTLTCNSWIHLWHCFWNVFSTCICCDFKPKAAWKRRPKQHWASFRAANVAALRPLGTLVSPFGSLSPPRVICHCFFVELLKDFQGVVSLFPWFPLQFRACAATALANVFYSIG